MLTEPPPCRFRFGKTVPAELRGRLPLLLLLPLIWGCVASLPAQVPAGPQTYERMMAFETGGFQRSYRVHIPAGYTKKIPHPLVIVIHGVFDTAESMEAVTGFSRIADREGFVVMYPNGIGHFGFFQHWNAGHCCGRAMWDVIDDVGFVEAAIDDLDQHVNIDPRRIYMTGFSNGGMFTYRFAAEKSSRLAAIAPLAATIGSNPMGKSATWKIPPPGSPIPVIAVHGRADADIPYNGGTSPRKGGDQVFVSVKASLDLWIQNNGCAAEPVIRVLAGGGGRLTKWDTCSSGAPVHLYTLDNWGHDWPGPHFTADLSPKDPLKDFDAAEVIWTFFSSCKREPASAR